MFLDYLTAKESELSDKIAIKKEEQRKAVFSLKENKRFSEFLDKEKTTPFVEFTPQVVSASDRKMQADLNEKDRNLQLQKDEIDHELSVLESELAEVSGAIKDAKDTIYQERVLHKEELKQIREKLNKICKEGEFNPAKAISSLRKLLHDI